MVVNFDEIVDRVKGLELPMGEYALFGSVPLAAHRIRESRDVDLLVTIELYQELRLRGWKEKKTGIGREVIVSGCFEAGYSWTYGKYKSDAKKLIENAEIVNGVPVVALEEVIKWKRALGRKKDLKDIISIERYYLRRDIRDRH